MTLNLTLKTINPKFVDEGLDLGSKLGKHFQEGHFNLERGLKFQGGVNDLLKQYEEVYKAGTNQNKQQKLISEFFPKHYFSLYTVFPYKTFFSLYTVLSVTYLPCKARNRCISFKMSSAVNFLRANIMPLDCKRTY